MHLWPTHRPHHTPRKRSGWTYYVPALLAITTVLIGFARSDSDRLAHHRENQRAKASQQLADTVSRLETNVRGNVNLVHGLVTAVAADPHMSQQRFSTIAERIFAVPSQLSSVAGAPDFVIRMTYPEDLNKTAIGLDYMETPSQRDPAAEAVARRTVMITGPVALVQGGQGLIARYPVFSLNSNRFWGVVSAVIDLDRLYLDSNLNSPSQTLEIAISRRPVPQGSDVFFGRADLLSQDPVTAAIDLGYDSWYLAAVPKGGWTHEPADMARFRMFAALASFFVVAPLVWAGLLMQQRNRSHLLLREREERLEVLSRRLQLALEASRIGVWEYHPDTDSLLWDSYMCDLYGQPHENNRGSFQDWADKIHPDDLAEAKAAFQGSVEHQIPYLKDFRIVLPSGEIRHIRAHGAVENAADGTKRVVGANWDVTDDVAMQVELRTAQAKAEEQNRQLRTTRRILEHQSLHDALTGLPNRRFLDQFMVTADTSDLSQKLAFIHIDLDHFKHVNDTLGHGTGDEVLKVATGRLREIIGPEEVISRIGGDEFVVVTCGPDPAPRAQEVALEIVLRLARPIEIEGQEIRIGCSAGIACQTMAGETPSQLLMNADIALYEAKKKGRNRVEIFSDDLRAVTIETKRTADELLRALECDAFIPFFQPQFDAQTLAINGVEALARWDHATKGILTPDKFLEVAEGLGRVAEIDRLILEKSLFQMTRWRTQGIDIPKLSVNISAQRLKDPTLLGMLDSLPIETHTLAFELLESISFEDQEEDLKAAIRQLKERGVQVEIDDFGSGHASIVSLLELAPHRLKIDRKLVAPIDVSESQRRLVASIIEIGRSLGIGIVAEGVETMTHAEILRELGCQTLQGYAFARPMSSADLMTFAKEWQLRHPPVRKPANLRSV